MPADPATTHTADFHLCVSGGRSGSQAATSAASTRWMRAPETSRPMSATVTRPARCLPGERRRPGLSAANVTVLVAVPRRRRPAR